MVPDCILQMNQTKPLHQREQPPQQEKACGKFATQKRDSFSTATVVSAPAKEDPPKIKAKPKSSQVSLTSKSSELHQKQRDLL